MAARLRPAVLAPPYRPFTVAVSVAGLVLLAAIAVADLQDVLDRADTLLLLLGLAILVAELFPLGLPDDDGEVSFSTTFAFALLLTDGTAAVVLVHAAALALADSLRRRPAERVIYNVAQYTIAWALAGALLTALTPGLPDEQGLQYLELDHLPAVLAAAAAFLALNTVFSAVPPALARGTSPLAAIRADVGPNAWWTAVMIALVPVILAAADFDLWLLPLLGVPLVAIQLGSRQAVLNQHRASHDELTGLPNRELLTRSLRYAIRRGDRRGDELAVLLVELERFKEVNGTLGHRRGDLVLIEAARRLDALARPGDLVARMAGGEFAIVLAPGEAADRIAAEVVAALREPVAVRGVELDVGAAVGVARHPRDGRSVDALLRHADVALERAKTTTGRWVAYEPRFDEHGLERLALVADLSRAIEEQELELFFQPKVALDGGALRGVEALVRWPHPERGLLAPEEFIEPAEHTGVIRPLTMWVVREALDQADRWRAEGLDVPVAVNLSVRSITPELPDELAAVLDGRPLELEITETVGMGDADEALAVLEQLTALGIRLSVDDFGTGFSSLAYLKRLPVSAIKIDRAFVTEMESDESDRAIVRSTIDLARHLGLEVVAEGVETEEAFEELRALGCDLAQGFAISPPLPAAELRDWVVSRETARGRRV